MTQVTFRPFSLTVLLVGLCLPIQDAFGEMAVAFPGAEGWGAHAQGGRGGDVYHVINLDDSGPGSLRYGIENMTGPRTIVFDLSGTIYLQSRLTISKPYLTIAGQTAPGDGITLARHPLQVSADHVVLRYFRVRLGDEVVQRTDAVHIESGHNIMIDHMSASWSIDEVMSAQSARIDLLTIQWSLIAEGLDTSHHEKGSHGFGGILGALRQSVHHNLYANLKSRAPKVSGRRHCEVDFRNNVIYNWKINNNYDGASSYMNWVNNYYKFGPATQDDVMYQVFDLSDEYLSPDGDVEDRDHETSLYAAGNFVVGAPAISEDNWAGGIRFSEGATEAEHRAHAPHDFPLLPSETSAIEAYPLVLERAGASLVRDSVDKRIVGEVRSGTATYGNGVIDSQEEVGGHPQLHSLPAPRDTDQDGMPNAWEAARGLDPLNPTDRNATNLSGTFYTNLEVYLNELVDNDGTVHGPVILGYGQTTFELGPVVHEDALDDPGQFEQNWIVQMSNRDPEIQRFARIEDGRLHIHDPRGATVWFKHRMSAPVMITYKIIIPAEQNKGGSFRVRDLNNFWMATSPGETDGLFDSLVYTGDFPSYRRIHAYYASTGGGKNTTTRMRRYPRMIDNELVVHPAWDSLDGKHDYLIAPDREILVQLVAYDDIVQYYNDGKLFYEVRRGDVVKTLVDGSGEAGSAVWGEGEFTPYAEGYFGFRSTHSHHVIRDFKVYRLVPRERN
jgi:pectate lyase